MRPSEVIQVMENDSRVKKAPVFTFEEHSKENPFKILVATMLSARTKDTTTIPIVRKLFSRVKTPREFLKLDSKKLEKQLYGIGFYKTKTKYLKGICKLLVEKFNGEVPDSLEDLLTLPGVGRKTANIVLARAFGKNTLGVDVHVHRISNRLGLVRTKKPEQTEKLLVKKVPKKYIRKLNRIFVAYGQTVCLPKNPKCPSCKLNRSCEYGKKQSFHNCL